MDKISSKELEKLYTDMVADFGGRLDKEHARRLTRVEVFAQHFEAEDIQAAFSNLHKWGKDQLRQGNSPNTPNPNAIELACDLARSSRRNYGPPERGNCEHCAGSGAISRRPMLNIETDETLFAEPGAVYSKDWCRMGAGATFACRCGNGNGLREAGTQEWPADEAWSRKYLGRLVGLYGPALRAVV